MKIAGMMLLLAGMAMTASAAVVPEIDASSGVSALGSSFRRAVGDQKSP